MNNILPVIVGRESNKAGSKPFNYQAQGGRKRVGPPPPKKKKWKRPMLEELKPVVLFMLQSESTCKELCDMVCTSERPMLPRDL